MLKCVIYLLTPEGYRSVEDYLDEMKTILNDSGVELIIQKIQNNFEEFGGIRGYNIEKYDKSQQLLISDSKEAVNCFKQAGFFVTAFYHEGNKDVTFAEVLYAVTDVSELTYQSYDQVYRRLAGIPWDILETPRLSVRESTVEDVEAFYRIYKEPSITYYMENLFQNPEEERAYIQDYIRQMYGFYGFGMWTVIEKGTGRIIGRAGFNIREGYDLPELGFVIEKTYQGKGYASEACTAVLHYAKEELLFDKVQAFVEEANEASVGLLTKLGFVYEKDVVENDRKYCLMIKKEIQ